MKPSRILLLLVLSPSLCNLEEYYMIEKGKVRPVMIELLNFDLSTDQIIASFKRKMEVMAPGTDPSTLGSNLSDVLFNYARFDPFSRRRGKEIDEKTFESESLSIIGVMTSSSDKDKLKEASNQMIDLIDGCVKISRKFISKSLDDFYQNVQDTLDQHTDMSSEKVSAFKDLQLYVSDLRYHQTKYYAELLEVKKDLIHGFETLAVTLILASFQPDFKESNREELKLRVLEVKRLVWIIFHFEVLKYDDIKMFESTFTDFIFKCKKLFDAAKFELATKRRSFSAHSDTATWLNHEDTFLELLSYYNRRKMKPELDKMRSKASSNQI